MYVDLSEIHTISDVHLHMQIACRNFFFSCSKNAANPPQNCNTEEVLEIVSLRQTKILMMKVGNPNDTPLS